MTGKPVPLIRRFSRLPETWEGGEEDIDIETAWFGGLRDGGVSWRELLDEPRVVILADAGAGKTFELRAQAERMLAEGRKAFFVRIEDIQAGFEDAFEVGSAEAFRDWLSGTDLAWFFLDSVDEVRLEEPRAFELAIEAFADRIRDAGQRARICISSRPYAWRARQDGALIRAALPFASLDEADAQDPEAPTPQGEYDLDLWDVDEAAPDESQGETSGGGAALSLYRLAPLDDTAIKLFAGHRGVMDVAALLAEIDRARLDDYARRPFDLEDIIAMWKEQGSLRDRLLVLQTGVTRQLALSAPTFGKAPWIERARLAARRLALATLLTGQANIALPGSTSRPGALSPGPVLAKGDADELTRLLSSGVFNDPIYGAVRFRHREVRDLLAAEAMADLIASGCRREVEDLVFAVTYGEPTIRPRLRPVLPWLILFDDDIRDRALDLAPPLATEGGDASHLPFDVRRAMLRSLVAHILDPAGGRAGDNAAVARIANADLEDEVVALLGAHGADEDVVFFLARLAWQARLARCNPLLSAITTDPARGLYSRVVSARAIFASDADAGLNIWRATLDVGAPLPRRLLAEFLDAGPANAASVDLLLASVEILEPWARYETTGLTSALHRFIARLPVYTDAAPAQPLATLAEGLAGYLAKEPHVERAECRVSIEHQSLMGPALHVVERLIAARSAASLGPAALTILMNAPALRQWTDAEDRGHKSRLNELVPRWPELNDRLFWGSVENRRPGMEAQGKALDDDWYVTWIDHFWAFDAKSFERTVAWIGERTHADDRMVALKRAFRTYAEAGKPPVWRKALKHAVAGDERLEAALALLFRPPANAANRRWRETERRYKRRSARAKATRLKDRAAFVERVKADPTAIRRPPGVPVGRLTTWQYYLLQIIEERDRRNTRTRGADWQVLIEEFGAPVAEAYRDAARDHWRAFKPTLRSEGADGSSIPADLIFGMAGLAIEAGPDFTGLAGLSEPDGRLALRYGLFELNGFPRWFEPLFRSRPEAGLEIVEREVAWELTNAGADTPGSHILHDLRYHAPWMHADLAPGLLNWLEANDTANDQALRYARQILAHGGVRPEAIARIAAAKTVANATPRDQLPLWYAWWVDTDPEPALTALTRHLTTLGTAEATAFMQYFLVSLTGGRRHAGPGAEAHHTPAALGRLYELAHRHVRIEDDIERANTGVYSPTRRDEAQDAREGLFSSLGGLAGREAYEEMLRLAAHHPDETMRPYMRRRARDRATADSDQPLWSLDEAARLWSTAARPDDEAGSD